MTEETHDEWGERTAALKKEQEAEARAEFVASTQREYPWRAALRTGIEVAAGFIVVALIAIPITVEIMGPWLPDGWAAGLISFGAFLTAVSTLFARLMAAEPVLAFVAKWLPWLSPKSAVQEKH